MSLAQQNTSRIKRLLIQRQAILERRHERVARNLGHRSEPLVSDFSDQAIQRQNDQTLQAIGTAAKQELAAIAETLRRIDRGLYGVCKACGDPIEAGRLRAVPHALLCAGCAGA